MLPKEINDLITQTGPGTPGGELMRRYWQPVALVDELPQDGPPVPVRLLSEDLVLFRDDQGRPGLIGLHCAHRGADLSYGRLEDGGLRCIYHGWLYDIQGRCLDQPAEPPGGSFADRVRHIAYPCIERAGAIFAYLGPGEPPLFPGYDFLNAPEGHTVAHKLFSECNFLQGNEGNIDGTHNAILHRVISDHGIGAGEHVWYDVVETEDQPYGVKNYWVRQFADSAFMHINHFLMPNLTAIGGSEHGYNINWHVPIDDTHHWKYWFGYRSDQVLDAQAARARRTPQSPEYYTVPNKSNRYLQDRALMKDVVFSGIANEYFQAQDLCATESWPIQDRTQELLGYGDRAIIAARAMLIRAIKDVQEGLDPPGVARDPAANHWHLDLAGGTVPGDVDWRSRWPVDGSAAR
jgi:phenylpropionate dioxygenase-like ring-hydroxylating dioxygenase large terminal subunit